MDDKHHADEKPAEKVEKVKPEKDPNFQEYPKWVDGVLVQDKAGEDALKAPKHKAPDHASPWSSDKDKK